MSALTPDELLRYARHLVLPEVGEAGQRRLKDGSVLIVGVGGLGSPLATYLAAAGVGRLGLVDDDRVEASNLQRQVLYGAPDVGREKLAVARERLSALNPQLRIDCHSVRLNPANAREILAGYDIIADGSDNFSTRYLVNDGCVLLGKPDVYGSVLRFHGQVAVFDARLGPCYRCLFPQPPPPGTVPSCADGGVLAVLPGIIGALQASEVTKLLLGRGRPMVGRLLLFDALQGEFRELTVAKDPECPVCGAGAPPVSLRDLEETCPGPESEGRPRAIDETIPGTPPAPLDPSRLEVSVFELKERLGRGEKLILLDVREPFEVRIASLPDPVWIPMGEIPARLSELDHSRPIIVYCHVGARSWHVARFLRARGYEDAFTLEGGIDAWAQVVDPSLPRY